ncbi:transducin/WD40 repeat-like superfamily protein [Striga asiatica]|uniref:U3 small nucleolar RNA-associated protein 18 homolog n=1 Tax=Striga asiatica TaxID=4170 RepID=A0A5A7RDA5_STRAF|nr:transducin/WD40 repeat-like superfamily protein [Striga asiatica]
MSLISQNAVSKEPFKKKKKVAKKNELALIGEDQEEVEAEAENENELDAKTTRNRKRGRTEEDKQIEIEQEEEVKRLENILFGSLYNKVEFGKDAEEDEEEEEERGGEAEGELEDTALFFTDKSANSMLSVYEEDMVARKASDEGHRKDKRKPAWIDDEEEKASINIAKVNRLRKLRKEEGESAISGSAYVSRLRALHMKMNPGTDWARPKSQKKDYGSEDEDSEKESGGVVLASGYGDLEEDTDNILRTNEQLVVKRGTKLLPGHLEYSRLVDANVKNRSKGPINSVQFHKNAQLLLVGGLDRTLRFFQVDGKKNEVVQSIFLEDCPIRKAAFLPDGSQAIVSGRRNFAYCFDLVNARVDKFGPLAGREEKSLETFEVSPDSSTIAFLGNEGYILLVSSKTKELIGTLKMNGSVRSVAFSNDGQKLLSSGGDGKIYHWDMRTRTCFHIGVDEGCLTGTSLCTSPVGNLFAAGSDSGIVNIYNEDEFLGGKRKPLKAIENLTTRVDFTKFNCDAQILAIGSRMKKNSMKMIHVPSYTVFSNWPRGNQYLGYPRCVDFSPRGGFMAMGNAAGKVLLFKLHHYHQA